MSSAAMWLWPPERLGEALEALSREAGLTQLDTHVPEVTAALAREGGPLLDQWLDAVSQPLGVEVEPVEASFEDVRGTVEKAGPALLRVERPDGPAYILLVARRNEKQVAVLDQSLGQQAVAIEEIHDFLTEHLVAPVRHATEHLIDFAGVASKRRDRARQALYGRQITEPVRGIWLLRTSPGASFSRQLVAAGSRRQLGAMLLFHMVAHGMHIAAWAVIGGSALRGRMEDGWLQVWGLLLLTSVPFTMMTAWHQGALTLRVAALLKRRLLQGVLRLGPEEIRHEGAGKLLGRVLESESLEALALGGGISGLLAIGEGAVALMVVQAGPGGLPQTVALLGCFVLLLLLNTSFYRRCVQWSARRIEMTGALVERMIGHRTRLAQLPRRSWHDGEDEALALYLSSGQRMDEAQRNQLVLIPRGWLLVSVATLVPAMVGNEGSLGSLAIGLGGTLLAHGALSRLGGSLTQLGTASVSTRQVAALFHAAGRREEAGLPLAPVASTSTSEREEELLVDGRDLHFSHPGRGRMVLRGAGLQIRRGERILLQGGSGEGKSTLVSVLTGLRQPSSGLLLLRGYDHATLGTARWKRRVVAAPQFHENHVITGTLAFNLLMGSQWPPRKADLEEAETLCRELGLSSLLDRMPGGLMQPVGETGWQLSHGERSRVFMARALLQQADVIILDESFAALDPIALEQTLRAVLRRAPTLVVIAHP